MRLGIPQSLENKGKLRQLVDKWEFIVFVPISQKQQNHIRKDGRNTRFLAYQYGIVLKNGT